MDGIAIQNAHEGSLPIIQLGLLRNRSTIIPMQPIKKNAIIKENDFTIEEREKKLIRGISYKKNPIINNVLVVSDFTQTTDNINVIGKEELFVHRESKALKMEEFSKNTNHLIKNFISLKKSEVLHKNKKYNRNIKESEKLKLENENEKANIFQSERIIKPHSNIKSISSFSQSIEEHSERPLMYILDQRNFQRKKNNDIKENKAIVTLNKNTLLSQVKINGKKINKLENFKKRNYPKRKVIKKEIVNQYIKHHFLQSFLFQSSCRKNAKISLYKNFPYYEELSK